MILVLLSHYLLDLNTLYSSLRFIDLVTQTCTSPWLTTTKLIPHLITLDVWQNKQFWTCPTMPSMDLSVAHITFQAVPAWPPYPPFGFVSIFRVTQKCQSVNWLLTIWITYWLGNQCN
jgi:hypothetical protein